MKMRTFGSLDDMKIEAQITCVDATKISFLPFGCEMHYEKQ